MEEKWGTPSARGAKNGVPHRPAAPKNRKNLKKRERNKKEGGIPQHRFILTEKVANMVPTWIPKWSQDGQKIDIKMDDFLDASWD